MMQVSLVEESESTVTLLKVTSTVCFKIECSTRGSTGASVVITAIMVAMLGMIMPEPLHIPPTVKVQSAYCSVWLV